MPLDSSYSLSVMTFFVTCLYFYTSKQYLSHPQTKQRSRKSKKRLYWPKYCTKNKNENSRPEIMCNKK